MILTPAQLDAIRRAVEEFRQFAKDNGLTARLCVAQKIDGFEAFAKIEKEWSEMADTLESIEGMKE